LEVHVYMQLPLNDVKRNFVSEQGSAVPKAILNSPFPLITTLAISISFYLPT
jgi:hypothetical protein